MQGPATFGELVSLLSLIVAALVAVSSAVAAGRRGASTDSAREQRMSDQLDHISQMCSETRQDVKEMNRKLDDHGSRITRLEEQCTTLFSRVERLEAAQDGKTD